MSVQKGFSSSSTPIATSIPTTENIAVKNITAPECMQAKKSNAPRVAHHTMLMVISGSIVTANHVSIPRMILLITGFLIGLRF